jgi:hypothetical protein
MLADARTTPGGWVGQEAPDARSAPPGLRASGHSAGPRTEIGAGCYPYSFSVPCSSRLWLIVGKFTPPRPIDGRMTVGAVMIFSGIVFLIQAVASS